MKFIWRFYWILKCKVYLAKKNNLPKHHAAGPQRRGAQCSCIGCIGLRPTLLRVHLPIYDRHAVYVFALCYHRSVIPSLWFCFYAIGVRWFFSLSERNYLRKAYFPVFTWRSLCFDLFISVLFSLTFCSFLAQHFIRTACRFQGCGCVELREINFLSKNICW